MTAFFVDLTVDRNNGGLMDNERASNQGVYNLDVKNRQISANTTYENGIKGSDVFNFIIHDLINVGTWNGTSYEYACKVRQGKEYPAPLFVYTENEDNYVGGSSVNTVRQNTTILEQDKMFGAKVGARLGNIWAMKTVNMLAMQEIPCRLFSTSMQISEEFYQKAA